MRLGLAIIGNSTASAAQLKVFSNDLTLGGEVGGRGTVVHFTSLAKKRKKFRATSLASIGTKSLRTRSLIHRFALNRSNKSNHVFMHLSSF